MKTSQELSALKEELTAMNKKLAELTDEELTQVAGGISRRTDDPEQYEANTCFNFAMWYVEGQSVTLEEPFKGELLGKINYVWDRTLSWHLANPCELLPIAQQIIVMLETVKDREVPLYNAWQKMKESIQWLEKLQKKDEEGLSH